MENRIPKATLKVYIATSWKNPHYDEACAIVRAAGHTVLDWKAVPAAFRWIDVDARFAARALPGVWTPDATVKALEHPSPKNAFMQDMELLEMADALVMLTPCGRSASIEAGIAIGRNLPRVALIMPDTEPETMLRGLDLRAGMESLLPWLLEVEAKTALDNQTRDRDQFAPALREMARIASGGVAPKTADTTSLRSALDKQLRGAREALDELVEVARESGEYNDDEDGEELGQIRDTVRTAIDLIDPLMKLSRGRTMSELHKAFGAPGDWGYETEFGAALSKFYSNE